MQAAADLGTFTDHRSLKSESTASGGIDANPHDKGNTMSPKALILTTSVAQMGNGGKPTGFYWEELADPYFALIDTLL